MRTLRIAIPFVLALAAMMPSPAGAAASEWAANEQSRVRLISPYQTAPRNGEIVLGLHFTLAPEWHVYWKNSGDAGYPPALTFAPAPGLGKTELLWPAPHRFELPGDLVAFGYEDEVVYPLRATLANATGDRLKLAADLDYLVCQVNCVPYNVTLTLDQPLGDAAVPDPETAQLLDVWQARVPVAAEALSGIETDGVVDASKVGAPVLEVRVRGAAMKPGQEPQLFLETHETFGTEKPRAEAVDGGVLFRIPLAPLEANKPLPQESPFAWTVTGLVQDGKPLALEARRTVPLRTTPATASTEAATGRDEGGLTFGNPVPVALLAVVAALAALWLWGVLGQADSETGQPAPPWRVGLGFAAAALTIGLLYGLSRRVSFEGLAWIELTLLAMGLCAWLRGRAGHRRALSFVLALVLAACAFAAPWLASRNRLEPPGGPTSSSFSS